MKAGKISVVPTFTYALPFEKNFDVESATEQRHFLFQAACCCVPIYLLLVYLGQAYMKNRTAWDLRWLLILWNSGLAVASTWGSLRTVPELYNGLKYFGFKHSMCVWSSPTVDSVSGFWYYIYTLVKFVELGDTAFLVLRKKKLMFLHWFHHSSVLLFGLLVANDRVSMTRWFVNLNSVVHSLMYTYFALRAFGYKLPATVSKFITSVQIAQMFVLTFVSLSGFYLWYYEGDTCDVTGRGAIAAVTLTCTYLSLFVHFFMKAYSTGFFSARLKKD